MNRSVFCPSQENLVRNRVLGWMEGFAWLDRVDSNQGTHEIGGPPSAINLVARPR